MEPEVALYLLSYYMQTNLRRIFSFRARFCAIILAFFLILIANSALFAQSTPISVVESLDAKMPEHIPAKPTKGKKRVEDAYGFQRRLLRGLETVDSVAKNWARTARDPEVRKDSDALAISYGCEGLMEIERDSSMRADSLLRLAMPYFKYKDSKSYFLVALAQLDSKLSFYNRSFYYYVEILNNFDSLESLKDILYYSESGYAPYAYGIDAALYITEIGGSIPQFKQEAIRQLNRAAEKHPVDALGLMALTGLKYLDTADSEHYAFLIEQLLTRKSELRKASVKFDKQFSELKK